MFIPYLDKRCDGKGIEIQYNDDGSIRLFDTKDEAIMVGDHMYLRSDKKYNYYILNIDSENLKTYGHDEYF